MHPGPDAFLQQVVGGRWRVVEVLGPTEHGAAFRVETLEDGRPARLELWDLRHVEERGELARFEREARTLSRLRHERCVSVLAFGAHEGRPYLVSDLPAGKPLRDELGKGELTVPRALALGLQLCEGLRHLHGHGAVHRALSPGNLWIAQSAAADVLKIGLPRFGPTTAPAEATDTTADRFYLPPHRPGARLDHRADLYAAGALLYVMCTGREPPAETLAAGGPVPPPRTVAPERGISEGLERVILRAMAPSPDVRFGTADDLMAALQSAGASPTTPKRRSAAQRPRQRTAIVAVAVAVVAILGARALRTGGDHEPTAPPAAPVLQTTPAASAVPAPHPPAVPPKIPVKPPVVAATPTAPPAMEPKPAVAPQPAPKAASEPAPKAAPEPAPKAAPEPAPKAAPEVQPAAEAAPRGATTTSGVPSESERREIWSLLDRGKLDEGSARIKTLVAKDPDAAWPRFALGVLYYRKYWRGDAVKQWQFALARDPEIRQDPQFGAYLCFMLDDTWKAAGMPELLNQLGAKAIPLVEHCAATAKTPRLRSSAARTLEQLRRPGQRSRR